MKTAHRSLTSLILAAMALIVAGCSSVPEPKPLVPSVAVTITNKISGVNLDVSYDGKVVKTISSGKTEAILIDPVEPMVKVGIRVPQTEKYLGVGEHRFLETGPGHISWTVDKLNPPPTGSDPTKL